MENKKNEGSTKIALSSMYGECENMNDNLKVRKTHRIAKRDKQGTPNNKNNNNAGSAPKEILGIGVVRRGPDNYAKVDRNYYTDALNSRKVSILAKKAREKAGKHPIFTRRQLSLYPFITKIKIGMEVVALDNEHGYEYAGLHGFIVDIKHGDDKESENIDNVLEIYVDYEIPESVLLGADECNESDITEKWLTRNYPDLNGTSITDVIMTEMGLGFRIVPENEGFYSIKGNYICPKDTVEVG